MGTRGDVAIAQADGVWQWKADGGRFHLGRHSSHVRLPEGVHVAWANDDIVSWDTVSLVVWKLDGHHEIALGEQPGRHSDVGSALVVAPSGTWAAATRPIEDGPYIGRSVELFDRGRGSIALFSGPPGTGKTMLAGLIAKGLGLELYQVDLSQVHSRWVGETEKALGRVFDLAERAHAMLLFDEADALLSKRTDVANSNDRYANAHVNYLLQRLEAYRGVAILTTNKDAALDEALQRRLTLHLRLDVPDVPERERLWHSFLPAALPRRDVDIAALAGEFELTGGYIKNVVLRAAFLAARDRDVVDTELLRRAAILELEDMGRVVRSRVA